MREANVLSLKLKIKRLESEVKEVKTLLKEEEIALLAEWSESGISRTTIDGKTLYITRRLWAGGDTDELVTVLRNAGLHDLVKPGVNRNTLTAYVKEVTDATRTMSPEEIHAKLPSELQEAIEVTEKVTFGLRSA